MDLNKIRELVLGIIAESSVNRNAPEYEKWTIEIMQQRGSNSSESFHSWKIRNIDDATSLSNTLYVQSGSKLKIKEVNSNIPKNQFVCLNIYN